MPNPSPASPTTAAAPNLLTSRYGRVAVGFVPELPEEVRSDTERQALLNKIEVVLDDGREQLAEADASLLESVVVAFGAAEGGELQDAVRAFFAAADRAPETSATLLDKHLPRAPMSLRMMMMKRAELCRQLGALGEAKHLAAQLPLPAAAKSATASSAKAAQTAAPTRDALSFVVERCADVADTASKRLGWARRLGTLARAVR